MSNLLEQMLVTHHYFCMAGLSILIITIISVIAVLTCDKGGVIACLGILFGALWFLTGAAMSTETLSLIPAQYMFPSHFKEDILSCIGEDSENLCLLPASVFSHRIEVKEANKRVHSNDGYIPFRIVSIQNADKNPLVFIKETDGKVSAIHINALFQVMNTQPAREHDKSNPHGLSPQDVKTAFSNSTPAEK